MYFDIRVSDNFCSRKQDKRTHPFLEVGSSNELMPTSITAAPGLIQSAFTISARPAAQTTMSASLTCCWEAILGAGRGIPLPKLDCGFDYSMFEQTTQRDTTIYE